MDTKLGLGVNEASIIDEEIAQVHARPPHPLRSAASFMVSSSISNLSLSPLPPIRGCCRRGDSLGASQRSLSWNEMVCVAEGDGGGGGGWRECNRVLRTT